VVGGEVFSPDTDGVIVDATTLALASGVAFVEDRATGAGVGFGFPTNTTPFADNGFFGPGVFLTSSIAEPASLALLALALAVFRLLGVPSRKTAD
jgi:hypothetical protein